MDFGLGVWVADPVICGRNCGDVGCAGGIGCGGVDDADFIGSIGRLERVGCDSGVTEGEVPVVEGGDDEITVPEM